MGKYTIHGASGMASHMVSVIANNFTGSTSSSHERCFWEAPPTNERRLLAFICRLNEDGGHVLP